MFRDLKNLRLDFLNNDMLAAVKEIIENNKKPKLIESILKFDWTIA